MFYILDFDQNKEPIDFKMMCVLDTCCTTVVMNLISIQVIIIFCVYYHYNILNIIQYWAVKMFLFYILKVVGKLFDT